jgi:outer membrane protein TolC
MRWLFLTILITATSGFGATARELTMDEAVRTALAGNLEIHAARQQADAAAARSDQASGHRLPKIDLAQVFNYTDVPAEVFGLKLNQERFDFGDFVATDPNTPDPISNWTTKIWAHTRERVVFETSTAFVNLAKAREHLELITKARATTLEHLALAEAYAEQGLILEAEVLKARVFLAEMDEMLEQAKNQSRLAEAALNFQLGADQRTSRTLATLPPAQAVAGSVGDWTTASLDRRHDLAAARQKLAAGRLEEKVARSGYLPEVAVVGRYSIYDDTIFGTNGASGGVMAVARINLYRGGGDSAARTAARHETASYEANIRRFEEGIELEVQQAWHDHETARVRLATAAEVLTSAREALRVREHRFRQGLDKMIDLLDAETALREAQMRELVARYDVSLSTYRLLFVSGGTLINSTEESS